MTENELREVINTFESTLAKRKIPHFKSLHQAEQVLRILKVDCHDFRNNENKRAGEYRYLWDKP